MDGKIAPPAQDALRAAWTGYFADSRAQRYEDHPWILRETIALSFGTGHVYAGHPVVSALHDARVLDIGCGNGIDAIDFAIHGASKVVGLDLSPSSLALARKQAWEMGVADKMSFVEGDAGEECLVGMAARAPLASQTFDIIWAIDVFPYLVAPGKVLEHLKKHAAQHAALWMTVPQDNPIGRLMKPRAVRWLPYEAEVRQVLWTAGWDPQSIKTAHEKTAPLGLRQQFVIRAVLR